MTAENNADLKTKIAVLEERLKQNENALKHQAVEYERRLDGLNNEARRLTDMQNSFVNAVVYELQHRVLSEKLETLKSTVEKRPTWVMAFIISLLLMTIGVIIGFIFK